MSVFITCAIAAGVLLVALLRDIVYAQGYAHGRRDEQDWWSDLENATDEARQGNPNYTPYKVPEKKP